MVDFIIVSKNVNVKNNLKSIFLPKKESSGFISEISDEKKVFVFLNPEFSNEHILKIKNNLIILKGTVIYKKLYGRNALLRIYYDFKHENLEKEKFKGDFIILIADSQRLTLILNQNCRLPLYFSPQLNVLSTSFLVLTQLISHLTFNKTSFLENLLTGLIIGKKTLFKEIERVKSFKELQGKLIDNVILTNISQNSHSIKLISDYEECIRIQLEELFNYFEEVKYILEREGAYLGLSGGYDSRLLFALATFFKVPLRLFTFYKISDKDLDLKIAKKIADFYNVELKIVKITLRNQFNIEKLEENLSEAYYFMDGQIRLNVTWTEEYRQFWHREMVKDGMGVELNGIGGEQYRNHTYIFEKIKAANWIKFEVVDDNNYFIIHPKYRERIIRKIWENLKKEMYWERKTWLDLKDIKDFYYKVWLRDGAFIRFELGNQVSWFLAPFTDEEVQKAAARAIKCIRFGGKLEGDLIYKIAPELAHIESNYSSRGIIVPKYKEFIMALRHKIIPVILRRKLLERRKQKLKDNKILMNYIYSEFFKYLKDLLPEIDFEKLKYHELAYERAIALGYFVKRYIR